MFFGVREIKEHDVLSSCSTGASQLTPAPLRVAVPIFAATSLVFFFALYLVLPALRNRAFPWFAIYNIVLVLPTVLLVFAALVAYALEGRSFTWAGVRERFRLGKMESACWFWTAALSIFMFGGRYALYIAFALTVPAVLIETSSRPRVSSRWLLGIAAYLAGSWLIWQSQPIFRPIPLHSEPQALREFLEQFGATSFMGIPLSGNWWIPAYYLAVLLVGNIAGEELWWRGYLLPRQELVHGASTWVVHGVLWAAFHLFFQTTAWDMIRMIPTCCALAFVAQHTKNTWPGIVGHTFGNSGFLLQILHGV